jgi:hypothetical protein
MLIFIAGSGTVTAAEIIVQSGSSVQAAVNSASSGDVIIVKPGLILGIPELPNTRSGKTDIALHILNMPENQYIYIT